MTDALTEFAKASSGLWGSLVVLSQSSRVEVLAEALAAKTGGTKGAITVKLRAIRYARESGISWEQITADGQSVTLQRFAKANRKNTEKRKRMCFLISASLADAFMCEHANPDGAEATMSRIQRVCKINTSEEAIELIKAIIDNMSDLQLRHEAGLITADEIPRKRKHAKA